MLRARTFESAKAGGMYENKKVKRYRSAFTTSQLNYLEKQFEKCPYIGSATRKEVANILSIPERAIKIWFQNRRMKEKKELNNKEINIYRHNILMNNIEFAKDSLNNVHSSQSANDHQCSLHASTGKHVDRANCRNYSNDATFPNRIKVDNLKKETNDSRKQLKFKGGVANRPKQVVERTFSSEPTDLLKYNLNRDCINKNFGKYLELNKKVMTKSKGMPDIALKAGSLNTRDPMFNIPHTLPGHQDSPEDLSARNFSKLMVPQNHKGNIDLSSPYIPLCDTQHLCLSAGNVIWKPVSVLPAVSPNAVSVSVPDRQQSIKRNDLQKCECNCNCRSRNRLNYDQRNMPTQPQYVIAIPYSNNLNILR